MTTAFGRRINYLEDERRSSHYDQLISHEVKREEKKNILFPHIYICLFIMV
jgi:hypothetical protein